MKTCEDCENFKSSDSGGGLFAFLGAMLAALCVLGMIVIISSATSRESILGGTNINDMLKLKKQKEEIIDRRGNKLIKLLDMIELRGDTVYITGQMTLKHSIFIEEVK